MFSTKSRLKRPWDSIVDDLIAGDLMQNASERWIKNCYRNPLKNNWDEMLKIPIK